MFEYFVKLRTEGGIERVVRYVSVNQKILEDTINSLFKNSDIKVINIILGNEFKEAIMLDCGYQIQGVNYD